MTDKTITVEIPGDCFIAHSFNVAPCPCGCGTFKLVGFDEKGVVRALIAVEAHQLVLMAAMAANYGIVSVGAVVAEKETKH